MKIITRVHIESHRGQREATRAKRRPALETPAARPPPPRAFDRLSYYRGFFLVFDTETTLDLQALRFGYCEVYGLPGDDEAWGY
jgi:hypothetical protein